MKKNELRSKVVQATFWSSITQIATKLIPPVSNMILARILTPEMFGVVATFTLVISFASIFTDAGFHKYVIQHEFKNEEEYSSGVNVAFWTNLILSMAIWLIIALFSEPVASFVGSEGHGLGITIACISIPLGALSSIQTALFSRDFDFKTMFWVNLSLSFAPLVITVPLAYLLRSYWALVIGTLIRSVLNIVLLSTLSPWKPRLSYSIAKLKEMFSFSFWTMIEQISIWLTINIDIFLVSRLLPQHYLGMYKTTITTVGSIFSVISSSVTPVLFAALSRTQNQEELFRNTFFKFQRLTALLVFPLGIGCLIYGDLMTEVLLGHQWLAVSEFMGLYSFTYAMTFIFSFYNSEIMRSKGSPKLSLTVQCIQIVLLAITFYFVKDQDFRTLYFAKSLVSCAIIFISSAVVWIYFNISFLDVFKSDFPILFSATLMGIVGYFLRGLFENIFWQYAVVLICVLLYAGVLLLGFPKLRKELFSLSFVQKILSILSIKTKNTVA